DQGERALRAAGQRRQADQREQRAQHRQHRQHHRMQRGQPEIERGDRTERRGVGCAQHRGLGQWIAQIALQRRPGQAEHRAHAQAEQHARQAQLEQDGGGDPVAMAGEGGNHPGERQMHRAEEDRADRGDQREGDQPGDQQGAGNRHRAWVRS
ncbi:hypothetical protein QU39_00285, partial [Staphylococcus aureus]